MASQIRALLFFALCIGCLSWPVLSDLVISKVDRKIDLTTQVVRTTSVLKIENAGSGPVSDILLSFPNYQAKKLAYLKSSYYDGTGKAKGPPVQLQSKLVELPDAPPELTFYSVSLPKQVKEGESFTLTVLSAYNHLLAPFPEEITQADAQLALFQDSAHFLSPYHVRSQSLRIQFPSPRVESFTKLQNSKLSESELKYGPYENLPPYSYSPFVVHFETNRPFAVARELVREIEISLWGGVQLTEQYNLVHGGARNKGGFSRFDYQTRYQIRSAPSFNKLVARLPPRAHSIYYRDEIGNISTSNVLGDSKKTQLIFEPRYPMFGGWQTTFTIGYTLPLEGFLYEKEGKRFLNITFGCPLEDVVVDSLVVKVVLPEGSKGISTSIPFPTNISQEIKYSHLDLFGRPVVVLHKTDVVPDLNEHFQVYFKFNNMSLLMKPLLLIAGIFFFFLTCIAYTRIDISISKSSPSYLAKLQLDEVQAVVQQVQTIIHNCLSVHDKLEASLRDLSRTGDVQSCKAARKNAESLLKDSTKELKPLLGFLQSSPQAAQIFSKVQELVTKEKETQDRLLAKHSAVIDSFEKKHAPREIDNRIAPMQQKLVVLRQEVDDLLEVLEEF